MQLATYLLNSLSDYFKITAIMVVVDSSVVVCIPS